MNATAEPYSMAETWHLSAELCRRFLAERVSRDERRAIVRHLITKCPECLALAARMSAEAGYWSGAGGAAAVGDADYGRAFETAFAFASRVTRQSAIENLRGWGHWSALDPLLPQERLPVIIDHKDWHHGGLFRALLDAADWYSARDPQEAADIAQLALDSLNLLASAAVGSEAIVMSMRSQAFALLATCRERAGDLDGARVAIAEAWQCHEAGASDPFDQALILEVDASYTAEIGDFETALATLEKALAVYAAVAQDHFQGRTLIEMGETIGHVDPERGLTLIARGLDLLNPVREPRFELRAQHHLAEFLCAAGRPREALAVLDRIRPLYRQFQEDVVQLRLHWLQGRIAQGLQLFGDAVAIYRLVREEFRVRELRRETLLVTIDLAEAQVGQGEVDAASRLLAETTSLLASWEDLHRNGLAAWLAAAKALEVRRHEGAAALAKLFADLRLYYRRYWRVPSAEFSAD
jgi:tetratricopeptide (TPR) repeat protein